MISLLFTFLAASCASFANLLLRKNTDGSSNQSTHFYLLSYYGASFLLSFVLIPSIWQTPISWVMVGIGSCVGALNVILMLTVARALQAGPSGLTFAFQNASAVFPGLLLYLLFGSDFGFSISYYQVAGIALVIYGLFAGARGGSTSSRRSSEWLLCALACGLLQVAALTLMQGRCILFEQEKLGDFLSSLALGSGDDAWFMPAQFGTAFVLQALLIICLYPNKARLGKGLFYGFSSGLANGICTFLLLLATKLSISSFKVILFPCFAVLTIILCSLWSSRLYKERFNLRTNLLCAAGILLAVIP